MKGETLTTDYTVFKSNFPNGKFIFLDVETPNLTNSTICSIGLIIIDNKVEIVNKEYLINPLSEFDQFNINFHKISPSIVKDCMTFKEFWEHFEAHFDEEAIIVAHNTRFDMTVIKKDLARFNIKLKTLKYMDTMDLFKKFYYKGAVEKGNLKLNNISNLLGIELDHHNALSDTRACLEIFKYVFANFNVNLENEVKVAKK